MFPFIHTFYKTNIMLIQSLHIDVVCVSLRRPGSVLADYTISATSNSLDFGAANKQVSDSLRSQDLDVAEDAFAQIGKRNQCLI